jgi:tRNA uridine 5-carboxymethylaminomethyl modification enzyme
VFEVLAMGGICGRAADEAGMHFRRLNHGRGPAVRGTRLQCDRAQYSLTIARMLQELPAITVIPGEAAAMEIENNRISKVRLEDGSTLRCRALVIASGTFLGAKLYRGEEVWSGGRLHEGSSDSLARCLQALGIELRRLKTGTPPRLATRGIDFSQWTEQPGEEPAPGFMQYYRGRRQLLCYKSATNEAVHDALRAGFERSPLFTGRIAGVGPPYCPSIEDKVRRYPQRPVHPLFLEPEGWDGELWYLAGFSSSLSAEVQEMALRLIPGLAEVQITQYAYAVEYWAIRRPEMDRRLGHPNIGGLYWAGQVCGTSGYEEAAGLGLVAGVNAAGYARSLEEWTPFPQQSYIGVMVRDLVDSEQEDPYRIFTSRAENRLGLREYNARYRLAKPALALGLISEQEYEQRMKEDETLETGTADEKVPEFAEEMDARQRYRGYIARYEMMDERMRELWERQLGTVDWDAIANLSNDGHARVKKGSPQTLGAVARLGVRYADLLAILAHVLKSDKRGVRWQNEDWNR